jgi:hypothetical protein
MRYAEIPSRILLLVLLAAFSNLNLLAADESDPVLNLLLQKGVISQEELEKAKAEAAAIRERDRTNMMEMMIPESKWKFTKAIKSVEFFGDVRVRYEGRSATDPGGDSIDLDRYRYALRFGLRADVLDNFYAGFRIDTSPNARSAWVTFGSSSSGTPYQGPFGKSTAGINVGQIFLGWHPTEWFDVTVGKMANPLYTTPMVWDSDFNPEGVAERFKYTVGPVDLFANFGQFIYQDVTPSDTGHGYFNILGYEHGDVPWLLAWQAGFNYHLTERLSLKAAPVFYYYTGYGKSAANQFNNPTPSFDGTFVGQGSSIGVLGSAFVNLANGAQGNVPGSADGFFSNETGIRHLQVIDIPVELIYKWNKIHMRVFGDYAQNLDGGARAQNAYEASQNTTLFPTTSGIFRIPSPQRNDVHAYQMGLAVASADSLGLTSGAAIRRHGWELKTYWQHIEQYALDPNLLDSDFFEGRGNLQGVYVALAYGFTDNISGTVRYGYAERINSKLGTGGSNQDIPQMNPINRYDIIQVDLGFRF